MVRVSIQRSILPSVVVRRREEEKTIALTLRALNPSLYAQLIALLNLQEIFSSTVCEDHNLTDCGTKCPYQEGISMCVYVNAYNRELVHVESVA